MRASDAIHTTLPAQPGFRLLLAHDQEDGSFDVEAVAAVAHEILDMGDGSFPRYAVVTVGLNGDDTDDEDAAVESPDGQVVSPYLEIVFVNREAWITHLTRREMDRRKAADKRRAIRAGEDLC